MPSMTYFHVTGDNRVIKLKANDPCPICGESLLIEDTKTHAKGTELPILWCPVDEIEVASSAFTIRVA